MYTKLLVWDIIRTKLYIKLDEGMNTKQIDLALIKLTALWKEAANKSIKVPLPEVTFTGTMYSKKSSSERKGYIKTEFVVVHPQLLQMLKSNEQKMVIQIMAEMKINNALWSYNAAKNSRYERTISSLKKREIIFETDMSFIFIINPWWIRKGDIRTVIVATAQYIEQKKELSPKMITSLKTPDLVQVNAYFALQS